MKTKFLKRVLWLMIPLLTIFTTNAWGDTYTKVTSLGDVTTGDYVIIGCKTASSFGILTYGSMNDGRIPYTSSYTSYGSLPSSITDPSDGSVFTLTVTTSGGTKYVTIYNGKNSKYIKSSAGTHNGKYAWDSSTSLSFTIQYESGSYGTFRMFAGSTYYLGVNSSANWWRGYASSTLTATNGLTLYKKGSSCSVPTGLNNSSISSTGATLSVTSSSANYDLYYSTSSTAPTSGTSATTTISSGTSKNITGLNYGTKYYYWARHDCGGGSKSDWVAGSGSYFTTTAPAPTSVAASSPTTTGATLTITDSYNPASYDIYYSTSSTAPVAGTTPTTTSASTTKALTGLTSGKTYYYWVRGHGPDAQSTWVAGTPATFTTVSLTSISVNTAPTKTVYLEGETFDPTGLVITRTYSNSTSDTYTYAGHTGDFSFSPTTATALTTSNTAVTITYDGKTVDQSITVYSVTLQALDENGEAIRVGGPATPTRVGATVTKAANSDNYIFKEWVVSNATLSDGGTNQKIITNPTGNVTVTVKYYLPRTVRWIVNGEEWTPYTTTGSGTDGTAEVARGAQWKTLTLPTDPDPLNGDGCGHKFVGWTNAEISGKLDKDEDEAAISTLVGSNLLNSANKSSKTNTINANPYTFYAVFVDYVGE